MINVKPPDMYKKYIYNCCTSFFAFAGTEDSVGDLFQMTSSSNTKNKNNSKSMAASEGRLALPTSTVPNSKSTPGRRKKPSLNSWEQNVRRIESNERERLRMHGLNEAFQVCHIVTQLIWYSKNRPKLTFFWQVWKQLEVKDENWECIASMTPLRYITLLKRLFSSQKN